MVVSTEFLLKNLSKPSGGNLMIRMIHMEVDHLTLYIIVYNPPKSKTTPLFGRLLFMDDHPFEATGFFRPGWVTTKS